MKKAKRILTRAQVLAWRGDEWSHTDKRAVTQSLELLPPDRVEYYEEPGGRRVIATVDGDEAFVIRPGFVSWTKGVWADGADPSLYATGIMQGGERDGTMWATLSTYRDRQQFKKTGQRDFGTCPEHHLKLSATGICDLCD